MRVVLVSDVHLGGPDDPTQAEFLEFLRTLECDRLMLLGDIFQHWWHFPTGIWACFARASATKPTIFREYEPVIEALSRFNVGFVPGNHDFCASSYFPSSGPVVLETWDGTRVHLTHGDEVDVSFGYGVVSEIVRGRLFGAVVTCLGPRRAWRFLSAIAHPPRGEPDTALVDLQRVLAARRIAAGADLVVMGHTHAPELTRVGSGWFANLGDWVSHRTYLVVEGGVPRLCHAGSAGVTAEDRAR